MANFELKKKRNIQMNKVFAIILLLFIFCKLPGQNNGKIFTDQRIRYSFTLSGNAQSTCAFLNEIIVEPKFGGNVERLIDSFDYGTYRYQLHEMQSGKLLFSKGFSPLFQEWQATEEAHHSTKEFQQSVFFPRPLTDVILKIEYRKGTDWNCVLADTLLANDKTYISATGIPNKVVSIIESGNTEDKIDLYFLAEGYTSEEQELFFNDAQRISKFIFSNEPFKRQKDRFNVKALMVDSQESGTDEPQTKHFRNTAFNSSFGTFGSERYLTVLDMNKVYNAAALEPWEHLIILVNSNKYGGGGCYNFECIGSSHNKLSELTIIHEFGHAFAALGDEYYDENSSSFEESIYPKGIEPWEPNLTTLANFKSKWEDQIKKETPIPTPRTKEYTNAIGVFEGGGYETKNVYSPAITCWMKEFKTSKFCPVCQIAIEKMILSQSR